MNMFTKLLETLGNNFWLIIILCLEVILAVWRLCFARGKKKNRAAEQCGELRFSCKRICVRDVLNLFNVQTAPFALVRTVIYPRRMKVQLLLSQASAGTPQPEGKMQARCSICASMRAWCCSPGSYTRVCELLEKAVYGGIALEVYEERTVQSFLEHLVTTNKNTSFKTRFKLHYAGLLYPWFARAQKAQLTD